MYLKMSKLSVISNSPSQSGTVIGASVGFLRGVLEWFEQTSPAIIETVILSALGAAVGFFITSLLRKLFPKKQ